MFTSKKLSYFLLFFLLLVIFVKYFKFYEIKKTVVNNNTEIEKKLYNSNVIIDVKYVSKDSQGNKYTILAKRGEIDISNSNVIFLNDVITLIELTDSSFVKITSNFGKHNINNYDTIYSKNVIIDYLNNRITGDYLDFSMINNSLLISKNVIYKNLENILYADAIEMNIKTKDTIIYMHDSDKKVKLNSLN